MSDDSIDGLDRIPALLIRTAGRLYAVPIAYVVETMRCLPVEPVSGAPSFVRGLAIIRGGPMPVVDLGSLGSGCPSMGTRLVVLRIADRHVALAVDEIVDVRAIEGWLLDGLPPLLSDGGADVVEAVGVADAELLVVLRAGRLIPDEVWRLLDSHEVSA